MGRLAGKAALIFGAGSVGEGWGNGRATAAVMLREGAQVFGTDADGAALSRTVEMVAEHGRMPTQVCDVTSPDDNEAAIRACRKAFGRIDILVNNVGGSVPGDVVSLESGAWDRQFATNIDYVFETMKRVVPIMVEQGGGSIVNNTSVREEIRCAGGADSYAPKGGLRMVIRTLALELAPKSMPPNNLTPVMITTPMTTSSLHGPEDSAEAMQKVTMGHPGEVQEMANAALVLASVKASYVTGLVFFANGGLRQKVGLT